MLTLNVGLLLKDFISLQYIYHLSVYLPIYHLSFLYIYLSIHSLPSIPPSIHMNREK